jgi:hypothetical protein
MGKSQREKGARGERAVVRVFQEAFERLGFDDLKAQRILTETRESSFDVELIRTRKLDVKLPGMEQTVDQWTVGQMPYAIQVKNRASRPDGATILLAYREARRATISHVPVGVVYVEVERGRRGREWLACLPLEALAELISKAHGWDVQNGA